jgi:hypothetical protein
VTDARLDSTEEAPLEASDAMELVTVARVLATLETAPPAALVTELRAFPAESVAEATTLPAEPVTEAMALLITAAGDSAADDRIPMAPVAAAEPEEAPS